MSEAARRIGAVSMNPKRRLYQAIDFSERVGLKLKKTSLSKRAAGRFLIDLILLPSDLKKIVLTYNEHLGRVPHLIRPRNFNEHLQQAKLMRRKKLYTQWADKIAVRAYVEGKIGTEYLTRLLWCGSDVREVDIDSLPASFIIKPNQGSGVNIIVRDKQTVDWNAIYNETKEWLLSDNSIPFAEWQYRWIDRKILIEQLLVDAQGGIPMDYKFFCFHGRVEIVQVDHDRFGRHTRNLYDRQFTLLPVSLQYPNYEGPIEKPSSFEEMVLLAEVLSDKEPFVRVDFYHIDRPIFGEITLHPGAGVEKFTPEQFDITLGKLLETR
jgi:hypothetical protein